MIGNILLAIFATFVTWYTVLPQFRFYRKWEKGLWFRRRGSFGPWFVVSRETQALIDSYPAILDSMSDRWDVEDYRLKDKKPELRVV